MLLLQLLALAYAFLLPGALLSVAAGRDWSLAMRIAGGLTLGWLTVPLLSFSAAWVLETSVRPWLVLAAATAINLAAGAAVWRSRA